MSDSCAKVLLVSYLFPPGGGAGVARVLKFAKYLPSHEIAPTVLTASNPSVPVMDMSRVADTEKLEVLRARTLEPRYGFKKAAWDAATGGAAGPMRRVIGTVSSLLRHLLVPDPQVLWQPAAQWTLLKALLRAKHQIVFISGPPFSQFLLAPTARAVGRVVVLDYRDEWSTLAETYEMAGSSSRWVARRLEPLLLRSAHAVTTATPAFADSLRQRFPFLRSRPVVAIPNGFDPQDFPTQRPDPPENRFVITYAGTVFRLTRPAGLLGAIRRLHRMQPELASALDVRFIGRVVETEKSRLVEASDIGVRCLGYLDHSESLRQSSASHLNLCLLADAPGTERIYPQKIFELLHLNRPILTLAPDGALTELVRGFGLDGVFHPDDEDGIARFLETQLQAFKAGRYRTTRPESDCEAYARPRLAGELAALFRSLLKDRIAAG